MDNNKKKERENDTKKGKAHIHTHTHTHFTARKEADMVEMWIRSMKEKKEKIKRF